MKTEDSPLPESPSGPSREQGTWLGPAQNPGRLLLLQMPHLGLGGAGGRGVG